MKIFIIRVDIIRYVSFELKMRKIVAQLGRIEREKFYPE